MPLRPVLLAVALAALVAGCLQPSPATPAPPATYAQELAAAVPPAAWDGETGIAWWEGFVQTYTKRDATLPANDKATGAIAASLRGLGLDVQVLDYPLAIPLVGRPLPVPAVEPVTIQVVVGTRLGTTQPDHAIALGGHYDTQAATIQGAYDNGAGTAMVYNVCREMLKAPMQKTLLCLFFDGEELGLLGSKAYLSDPPAGSPTIDAYLGYDMTGMNWPGYPEWKLYNWVDAEHSPELFPLVNDTVHQVLDWPESGAEAFPQNTRSSDEASFADAHIPNIRFAGGLAAGDYDQYHKPDDTVDHVYQVVGGRDNFMAGFGAIVHESYLLGLELDQTSLEQLKAHAN